MRPERRRAARGMTLIEVLVVVALAALLMGSIVMGMGALTNARLKSGCTLVQSAVRAAWTRASATAKPQRVVFDFKERRIWLEEGSSQMLVVEGDYARTGGADPATAAEKKAAEEGDRILKGPRPRKPSFKAVKAIGFEDEEKATGGTQPGRTLGRGIHFREIYVSHQVDAIREGRAYLYVWPGGQTEVAYIQLAKGDDPADSDTMTLFVHPLTGKVKVVSGAKTIRAPQTDQDASEREDRGVF